MRHARRAGGRALAALGLLVLVAPLFMTRDFTPELGIKWNFQNMEVVLSDSVKEYFMGIREFRERYPMYDSLPDAELASRLHAKYFSGMELDEYKKRFMGAGDRGVPPAAGRAATGAYDKLGILGEKDEYATIDNPFARAILTQDAMENGLLKLTRRLVAFKYRYAAITGLLLMAAGLFMTTAGRKKKG